ncbi:MAG: 50S ribosomal protein L30 [Firmicutes bacterium]|nr:50S ribosomal protein L30 [Bacillota bacterium]
MANKIRITLVKSPIGYAQEQRDTTRLLGLRKMHHSVIMDDTPSIRGMIHKVEHLVQVDRVDEDSAEGGQA